MRARWAFLLLMLTAPVVWAEPLTFAWNAPTTYGDGTTPLTVSYYTIRWGTTTGVYTTGTNASVGACTGTNCQYTVQGLDPSVTYFYVIVACDALGACSAPSNEITGRATLKPALSP